MLAYSARNAVHFHISIEKAPVNPQGYDSGSPPLSTLRWSCFCSPVQPRYQSRAEERKKYTKYAQNVHPEVYKGPWWPAHRQRGAVPPLWSPRGTAEENTSCITDSSTNTYWWESGTVQLQHRLEDDVSTFSVVWLHLIRWVRKVVHVFVQVIAAWASDVFTICCLSRIRAGGWMQRTANTPSYATLLIGRYLLHSTKQHGKGY